MAGDQEMELWPRTPTPTQMTDGRNMHNSLTCTAIYSHPLRSFYFLLTVGMFLLKLSSCLLASRWI